MPNAAKERWDWNWSISLASVWSLAISNWRLVALPTHTRTSCGARLSEKRNNQKEKEVKKGKDKEK